MSVQPPVPSPLSPGIRPSLPTGQQAIDIVEGALIGAFGQPQVSKWSHFCVGVRVKFKIVMNISHPHACYIPNPSSSSHRHTLAFQIPRYNALDCAHSSDHAVPTAAMNSVM